MGLFGGRRLYLVGGVILPHLNQPLVKIDHGVFERGKIVPGIERIKLTVFVCFPGDIGLRGLGVVAQYYHGFSSPLTFDDGIALDVMQRN